MPFNLFNLTYYDLFQIFIQSLITFVPVSVIASQYSWSLQVRSGTYAFIHDNAEFILVLPFFS